ncbi:jg4269, partial [Pararge aegeria aegeria]
GQHPNIVTVREIVVGSNMDKIFIVMDYVEHDLKSLMETMRAKKQVFLPGEVKCLMTQLLKAVHHLHDNWILHRDLKTSNLLLSHKGVLKEVLRSIPVSRLSFSADFTDSCKPVAIRFSLSNIIAETNMAVKLCATYEKD